MASSSSSSNLPRLLILAILISIFSLPVLHARDMQFFSKASHNTATSSQPATISTSEQAMDDQQAGYGLYGRGSNAAEEEEETYQYSPTTLNPTVASGKRNYNNAAFQMDSYSSVNEGGNIGNRWTGQGMSDRTRKPEDDGRSNTEKMMSEQHPRFSAEGENERGSHGEIYYNQQGVGSGDGGLRNSFYGTVDRQGMSDTRYLENGKYYYHVSDEDKEKKNKYDDTANSRGFDSTDDEAMSYEAEDVGDDEEQDGHDRIYNYENNKYSSHDGKQGMSDTRYMSNGRYFYDINKEKQQVNNNNDNSENNRKTNEYHSVNQDGYKSNAARFDFRNTVNKFPKYEFDSMEEYMKQNGYNP